MAGRFIRGLAAVAAAAIGYASLAGCGTADNDDNQSKKLFGYQVLGELRTTNAGTLEGATDMAEVLSGRLYPGVYVPGPSGQMIPNTDLVTTQVLPSDQRKVIYTLSDAAVFSDGTPVTCSDYLLTFTAGHYPGMFGSHMPLFDDTEALSCTPGAKEFTLTFKEKRGARWRGLFDAGTVLPAHAVAAKLDKSVEELDHDLQSGDFSLLKPIANVWRHGFSLSEFDPDLQVSFGPFKIAEVGERGEVTLVANEHYYGDAPQTSEMVVWPGSADSGELAADEALRIGDLRETSPAWHDVNAEGNRLSVDTQIGELTEALTFPEIGMWAIPENRQAFAKCVDPRAVAKASSGVAGLDVPVAPLHVLQHADPLAARLNDVAAPNLDVDIEAASALSGTEIRIGYPYPDARFAAMVESIRRTCEPAGITVTDVTEGGKTLADLPRAEYDEWGNETWTEGAADVILHATDPMREFPSANNRAQELGALRAQEGHLWKQLPSIPLAAQPRTFAVDGAVRNVVPYTGLAGIGWNMDRWQLNSETTPAEK